LTYYLPTYYAAYAVSLSFSFADPALPVRVYLFILRSVLSSFSISPHPTTKLALPGPYLSTFILSFDNTKIRNAGYMILEALNYDCVHFPGASTTFSGSLNHFRSQLAPLVLTLSVPRYLRLWIQETRRRIHENGCARILFSSNIAEVRLYPLGTGGFTAHPTIGLSLFFRCSFDPEPTWHGRRIAKRASSLLSKTE
jgi:hypothetical protein